MQVLNWLKYIYIYIYVANLQSFASLSNSSVLQTPYTSKALRQLKKEAYRQPTSKLLEKLFKATLSLAADQSIAAYRAKGLEESLRLERKKRSRGKRLNLVGESDSRSQLFSPSRTIRARDFDKLKVAKIQQEKEAKAVAKLKKQKEKERKELEAIEKAAQKAN
jgi:hypothetical protein